MHDGYFPSESSVTVAGAKAPLHPSQYPLACRRKLQTGGECPSSERLGASSVGQLKIYGMQPEARHCDANTVPTLIATSTPRYRGDPERLTDTVRHIR